MRRKAFGRPLRLLGSNAPAPPNHVRLDAWLTPQERGRPYRGTWIENTVWYILHGVSFEEIGQAERSNDTDPTLAHANDEVM